MIPTPAEQAFFDWFRKWLIERDQQKLTAAEQTAVEKKLATVSVSHSN
jgi:hypothetical protein